MINKHFFILVVLGISQIIGTLSQAPADHLVPPPAPPGSVRIQKSIPQFIPLSAENPSSTTIYNQPQDSPGFMQRIARWFGYGNGNIVSNTVPLDRSRELPQQQSQASYYQPQYKELPQGIQYNRQKAPCNPCNKVPWLPMFQQPLLQGQRLNNNLQILGPIPNLQNLPQQQHHQSFHQTKSSSIPTPQYQLINQPHVTQQLPQYVPNYDTQNFHVQRAVKFNYPAPNSLNLQYFTQQQLTPIPVPNLSATPIPPLFNAVPFHQNFNSHQQDSIKQFTQQQNHYNIQSHKNEQQPQQFEHLSQSSSEIQNVLPTQIPANDIQHEDQRTDRQQGFEVIQSIPVTDFVSTIEYPVKVIQSEVIDLSKLQNVEQSSNQNIQNNLENQKKENVDYPKLFELGSYEPQATTYKFHQTSHHHQSIPNKFSPDYISDPIIVHNHNIPDNFVAASSHNITVRHENQLDIGNYPVNHQTLTPPAVHEPFLPTLLPPLYTGYSTTYHSDYSTEPSQYTTIVDIQPSLQTASAGPEFFKKDRGTPKRLLDAPILYNHNNINNNHNSLFASSPRPFTRDPSELHIRSSTLNTPTTVRPTVSSTPWAFSPTPTSTYSSQDASGQWAGISPPAQFQPVVSFFESSPSPSAEKRPKQFHQIIIPYTTKNKPQPFKPREFQKPSTKPSSDNRYSGWSNSNEHQDYHEEQESKLVTATQITDGPTKKTTKYLTKILASNIRDLLIKEHEVKNKSFGVDLNQLQKNIDDWTEQEFTSLTHKPSTVSIRGRSKHIPHEYLTTTPSFRQPKTTRFFDTTHEQTTGINNDIQSLLLNNDFYSSQSIEDNNIGESKRLNKIEILPKVLKTTRHTTTTRTTTTRTPTTRTPTMAPTESTTQTTTTTTNQPNTQPFYIRNIKLPTENEVWQKVKVSISPLTKEKIYVVTPQPRFQMKTSTTSSGDDIGTFKSPRFLVRPTPASNSGTANHRTSSTTTTTVKPKSTPYSPELFGLMGISAYIPGAPVDVLDGHSRVITVVTPTPHTRKRSTDNMEKRNYVTIKKIFSNDNKS